MDNVVNPRAGGLMTNKWMESTTANQTRGKDSVKNVKFCMKYCTLLYN